MSLIFSIIGDSNVRQNINKNSCRASPLVKACQVLLCNTISINTLSRLETGLVEVSLFGVTFLELTRLSSPQQADAQVFSALLTLLPGGWGEQSRPAVLQLV